MRKKVLIALLVMVLAVGGAAAWWFSGSSISDDTVVLMYHLISDDLYGESHYLFVSPADFEAQVAHLAENGYRFVFARDLAKFPGEKVACITFDDGYVDNYTTAMPILAKYGACGTVFVTVNNLDKPGFLTGEQCREMAESGVMSIESHTVSHPYLSQLTEEQQRQEFSASQQALQDITGQPVTALAYPYGDYDRYVVKVAADYFDVAVLTAQPRRSVRESMLTAPRIRVEREHSLEEFIALMQ